MIFSAVGESSMADVRAEADRHRAIYEEFSPINHVDGDDPPSSWPVRPKWTSPPAIAAMAFTTRSMA